MKEPLKSLRSFSKPKRASDFQKGSYKSNGKTENSISTFQTVNLSTSNVIMALQRETTLLLDFQYLIGNRGEFIIKELACMKCDSMEPFVFHFKPPYSSWELDYRTFRQVRENIFKRHVSFF